MRLTRLHCETWRNFVKTMRKVLIIDDKVAMLEYLMRLLRAEAYETYGATDGITGVEMALQVQPDVIVCDIVMPRLDGYGVLKILRENATTAHIPLIFISVLPVMFTCNLLLTPNVAAYLLKPFTYQELLQTIQASSTQ